MVMHYEKDSVKENQFQALFPYMEIKLILSNFTWNITILSIKSHKLCKYIFTMLLHHLLFQILLLISFYALSKLMSSVLDHGISKRQELVC